MQNWNGKNTAKMHIRLTEDVARQVRAIADLEHRPIQDQLRFLIVLGLQAVRDRVEGNGSENRRTLPLPAAPGGMSDELQVFSVPRRAANRRAVTHRGGMA